MSTTRNTRGARIEGPLLAAAAALAVVAVTRLLPAGPPAPDAAFAGTVATAADTTVITSSTGAGEDVLTVLDQRSGTVLVYHVTPRRDMELLQVERVGDLFDRARAAGGGRR